MYENLNGFAILARIQSPYFPADVFMILGDLTYVVTTMYLLCNIWKKESSAGISIKTQSLFFLIITIRSMLLIFKFQNFYNIFFHGIYILIIGTTALSIKKFEDSNQYLQDSFRQEILVVGAAILAVLVHYQHEFANVMWSLSVYLEAVAIIPQLYMMSKTAEIIPHYFMTSKVDRSDKTMIYYIWGLAQYRILYILSAIHFYLNHRQIDMISIASGSIQAYIYCDHLFLQFTCLFSSKYVQCNNEEPNVKQPIYAITSGDLKDKESNLGDKEWDLGDKESRNLYYIVKEFDTSSKD